MSLGHILKQMVSGVCMYVSSPGFPGRCATLQHLQPNFRNTPVIPHHSGLASRTQHISDGTILSPDKEKKETLISNKYKSRGGDSDHIHDRNLSWLK